MTAGWDEKGVVTALRYDEPAVADDLAKWCGGEVKASPRRGLAPTIWVPTQRGPKPAVLGDWIVRTLEGDFYPCDGADFAVQHLPVVVRDDPKPD